MVEKKGLLYSQSSPTVEDLESGDYLDRLGDEIQLVQQKGIPLHVCSGQSLDIVTQALATGIVMRQTEKHTTR